MKHPSEYTVASFSGLHVMVVDSGTVIKDEASGREETVDDTSAVAKGRMVYCTQKTFDVLKAQFPAD